MNNDDRQRQWAAIRALKERERAVPCQNRQRHCHRTAWRNDGLCDPCGAAADSAANERVAS